MALSNTERQARWRRRRKEKAAQLPSLEEQLARELAVAARERRQGNALLERLLHQVAELRRLHGALEPPLAPRINRRRPLGQD